MAHTDQLARAVADTVAKRLEVKSISHRAAATATGIPSSTFVRRMSGRSPFDLDELAAIADLLGTTSAEIVTAAEAELALAAAS